MARRIEPQGLDAWLRSLSAAEVVDLVIDLAEDVPGVGEHLLRDWQGTDPAAVGSDGVDRADLARRIHTLLPPPDGFDYYYDRYEQDYHNEADDYVEVVEPVVSDLVLLTERRPDLEILGLVEESLGYLAVAQHHGEDSGDALGEMLERLSTVHAAGFAVLADDLEPPARVRLARWIADPGSSETGGPLMFDVADYTEALGLEGMAAFRALVAEHPAAGRHRARLAVLDRDLDAIRAAHGVIAGTASFTREADAIALVQDLQTAGFVAEAVAQARAALPLEGLHSPGVLLDLVVHDDVVRGDVDEALSLIRVRFHRFTSRSTFDALMAFADEVGRVEQELSTAESRLAEHAPSDFTRLRLDQGRHDDAWVFAIARPDLRLDRDLWERLLVARAGTHPQDAAPERERRVRKLLPQTGESAYHELARELTALREVLLRLGIAGETRWSAVLAAVLEASKRRPRCREILAGAGLRPG